jgi:hypothetical protein
MGLISLSIDPKKYVGDGMAELIKQLPELR